MSNKGKKDKPKLNAKQERFCLEYVIDSNATQAAIRAGYSEKTARATGSRLLTNVNIQARVSELQAETAKELKIDREWAINEYLELIQDCKEKGLYGNGEVKDRGNWNRSLAQLSILLGLDAPIKSEVEHKGITGIDVNIIRNKKSED